MKTALYASYFLIILFSCHSSRDYYYHGDYYSAVIKSVSRLKQTPTHVKSRDVLQKAYPLALQTLEAKSQNLVVSNDPLKFRSALLIYDKINAMYETILSSPAALEIIPQPKNYYKEIGELREGAADETYSAGVQSMMKGTRTDSRTAYQYFAETNALVPQYREVVEMLGKSEEESTLRIIWNSGQPEWWATSKIISAIDTLPFVELTPWLTYVYSDDSNKKNVALKMTISSIKYSEGAVSVSSSSQDIMDSVVVDEKKVKNVIVPIRQAIKGTYTEYKKTVESKGEIFVNIRDTKSGVIVFSREFTGKSEWKGTWTACEGDKRVFDSRHLRGSSEPNPDSGSLRKEVEDEIQAEAISTLTNLLADY